MWTLECGKLRRSDLNESVWTFSQSKLDSIWDQIRSVQVQLDRSYCVQWPRNAWSNVSRPRFFAYLRCFDIFNKIRESVAWHLRKTSPRNIVRHIYVKLFFHTVDMLARACICDCRHEVLQNALDLHSSVNSVHAYTYIHTSIYKKS